MNHASTDTESSVNPAHSEPDRSGRSLRVLYRDDHMVAIAKPSGTFVHRTDEDRSCSDVVVQIVRDQIGQFVYPVHRLDRATSGVVVLALDQESAAVMCQAFAERRVTKTYTALVRGWCPTDGCIQTPLVPQRGRGKPIDHPHAEAQEAVTNFHRLQTFEVPMANDRHPTSRCSLVQVEPRTGRYHQIRRHFNYQSHPIIGDTSHGDSRHNTLYRKYFGVSRLMLAATELVIPHPRTNTPTAIACPPDASFASVIDRLMPHASHA